MNTITTDDSFGYTIEAFASETGRGVRGFTEWQREAGEVRAGLAAYTERQTELANELRQRWDEWKAESGHATWDECLRAELGISAATLRRRNHKKRNPSAAHHKRSPGNGTKTHSGTETPESDKRSPENDTEADSVSESDYGLNAWLATLPRRVTEKKRRSLAQQLRRSADMLSPVGPGNIADVWRGMREAKVSMRTMRASLHSTGDSDFVCQLLEATRAAIRDLGMVGVEHNNSG